MNDRHDGPLGGGDTRMRYLGGELDIKRLPPTTIRAPICNQVLPSILLRKANYNRLVWLRDIQSSRCLFIFSRCDTLRELVRGGRDWHSTRQTLFLARAARHRAINSARIPALCSKFVRAPCQLP
jgi:hypothetical protein